MLTDEEDADQMLAMQWANETVPSWRNTYDLIRSIRKDTRAQPVQPSANPPQSQGPATPEWRTEAVELLTAFRRDLLSRKPPEDVPDAFRHASLIARCSQAIRAIQDAPGPAPFPEKQLPKEVMPSAVPDAGRPSATPGVASRSGAAPASPVAMVDETLATEAQLREECARRMDPYQREHTYCINVLSDLRERLAALPDPPPAVPPAAEGAMRDRLAQRDRGLKLLLGHLDTARCASCVTAESIALQALAECTCATSNLATCPVHHLGHRPQPPADAEEVEKLRWAIGAFIAGCKRYREALLVVSTDLAQDALEDPIGNAERAKAGWSRLGAGAVNAVRVAIDSNLPGHTARGLVCTRCDGSAIEPAPTRARG